VRTHRPAKRQQVRLSLFACRFAPGVCLAPLHRRLPEALGELGVFEDFEDFRGHRVGVADGDSDHGFAAAVREPDAGRVIGYDVR